MEGETEVLLVDAEDSWLYCGVEREERRADEKKINRKNEPSPGKDFQ